MSYTSALTLSSANISKPDELNPLVPVRTCHGWKQVKWSLTPPLQRNDRQ